MRSEQLRTSNSKLTKDCNRFVQRRAELKTLIKETENQITHLDEERLNFEEKHKMMSAQLANKERIINQKEQELKLFRNKNQHLKNFQIVYDYRLTTLSEDRVPLIEHMASMEVK